jgi:hypothetical protein
MLYDLELMRASLYKLQKGIGKYIFIAILKEADDLMVFHGRIHHPLIYNTILS